MNRFPIKAEDRVPLWLLGRLIVHEFMLEMLVANAMSMLPQADSDRAKADLFARRMQLPSDFGPVDVDEVIRVENAMDVATNDLLRKVSAREKELRAMRARR